MDNLLTWTQFATVMGMLTALAGITMGVAAYFFKQWQESAFKLVYERLDAIDARLEVMVTRDQLRAELAEMELRLRTEARPTEQA